MRTFAQRPAGHPGLVDVEGHMGVDLVPPRNEVVDVDEEVDLLVEDAEEPLELAVSLRVPDAR